MNFRKLSIALCFVFLQSIGLMPFGYSGGDLKPSIWFLVYHLFMFTFFFVLVISEVLLRTAWSPIFKSQDIIVALLAVFSSCATGLTIFITIFLHRRILMKLVQSTLVISKTTVLPSFWARFFLTNLINIINTWVSFILMEIHAPETKLTVTFQNVMTILFYASLHVIVNAFILLSGNLIRILTAVIKMNNELLKSHYCAGEFNFLLSRHFKIIRLMKKINYIFGPGWLLLIFYNALGLFYMSYHMTLKGMRTIDFIWTYSYIVTTVNIISATTSAASQAEKTEFIIFSLIYDDQDPISKTAESFCILQLHQSLRFDACSFFDLDWKIVITIISAVSTYALIFLQFRQNNNE